MSDPAASDLARARRRRRPWIVTGVAVALSLALVVVAWVVDRGRAPAERGTRIRQRPVAELVTPSPLTEQERDGTGPKFGSQDSVKLDGGAWVQVADAKGNLKQQYTASRIDPLPDKRLSMADPRAVLYGDGGRIVTMRSDAMTARVPRRELESGRLSGSVVIRIYRPKGAKPVDLKADSPDVVVESPEATFDAESGEIRCDRQVRITGEVITFEGEGLSLTLGADGKNIERLVIDRATAPVRISRAAAEAQAKRRAQDEPRAAGSPAAPAPAAAPAVAAAPASAPPPPTPASATAVAEARAPSPAAPPPGARLFLLTLHDSVEVLSLEGDRRTEVTGDRLDVVFYLRGGSGISLASGPFAPPSRPFPAVAVPGGRIGGLAAVAVGAVPMARDDADDSVTVVFKGRLVMAPAPAQAAPLGDPEAVRMIVTGSPALVKDSRSEAVIAAGTATFESRSERVRLQGTEDEPATVETPDFSLAAAHFELDRAAGSGRSDSPGSLVMGGTSRKPLSVSWATGMSLALAPGTGDAEGTFRGAEFRGEVDARSPDFRMNADRLAVEAAPVGTRDVPRRIVATGSVRARSLGPKGGRFEADRVEVSLTPDANAQAQPRTLVATGAVMAGDDAQTMWCSALRAAFVDGAEAAGAREVRSDLGEVVAEGPVELRLADGGRAFGTRLEADGVGKSARLFGPDVMVVRGNLVLDQLSEVRVQEDPTKVNALGPGRASGFRESVLAASDGPVGRPRITGLPQMQASWRESLAYEDGSVRPVGGGPPRGLLLLQGSVKVRASRDPRESEALDADEVDIEILPRDAAARPAQAARAGAGAAAQSVGTMRARGNVRLEARQWKDAGRSGEPQLFRMNAPNVRYDGTDGSAFVDGAGTLLVFDPPGAVPPERADDPKSPFSPKGTTRFSWKRSLAMERRPDGDSRITLEREVVMDHLGESTAATGTVTADRMMATVRALEGAKPAAATGDVGMSLGGPAELTTVSADGRVLVRTNELDIEANEFELDVPTQVGAARADPGRLVTVLRRGQNTPLRGHAFRWDLVKGTLAVEGARGAIGR